jgi:RimJ/RimL family protein N-acetyltransferase
LPPDWKYQTDKVYLAPYTAALANEYDGLLGHLYLRTKKDGLLSTAFPGLPEINFDKFVSYLSGGKVILQIYYLKTGETMTPIGYCYLYNVDGEPGDRLAEFGFCFFKEYWFARFTVPLGWLCIAYWFEELQVDLLYGATLTSNRLARMYCRRFGFEELGDFPKFLRCANGRQDGTIVVLEKHKFQILWRQHQEPLAA